MISEDNLPVLIVDLSSFTCGGDLGWRRRAAKELAEKERTNGSAGISDHGISSDTLEEAITLVKKLFDLPYHDIVKAPYPDGLFPHRGYSEMGREKGAAKTATETYNELEEETYLNASDYKTCSYEIGSEKNKLQHSIWLPEEVIPGFRKDTLDLF
ncbi:uncharacterized protein EAF01_003205 [Botrytis porri]|uniref:Non-haem dioxygenase N-terminal domain-containing protein n=1 Tax=Botrytis porri TaxID=87229 RepID=A0A4Z1KEL1_9HELO|nr:uncharacterized protein EAF01_003205 [Botrytis porri]KAF7909487.1 hypothetical protein EAF01_003205 [Botrytis porri]TGO83878.1 hypothetical protein BPOR_0580g00070 [Botrytis porri]